MNAEPGNEPESPKKRGRIPQSAWPRILERYRAGATLSAIAREFECTPSAISYIVRKAEAAGMEPGEEVAADDATDAGAETAASDADATAATDAASAPEPAPEPAPAPAPERSRTLRMSAPAPEPEPTPPAPEPAAPIAAARPAGGRPEPTPPVDAVEGRLRETARGCLAAYRNWRQAPGEGSIQTLSDAVHELRKALARIEIDMSASRREEQALRPIPIPSHRAARRSP